MGRAIRIGLYSPFFGSTLGGGEKYFGVTAEALRDAYPQHEIEVLTPVPVDRELYERMLGLDLEGLTFRATIPRVTRLHRLLNSIPLLRLYRNLAVSISSARFTERYDLFISMVYVLPAVSRARRGVILCQFPYPLRRRFQGWRRLTTPVYWIYRLPYALAQRLVLRGGIAAFERVVCQSEFVRHWVEELWHRDSLVVNPPIDVPHEEPDWTRKQNVIVSVGRFFAVGHSKRHDLLVEVFRQLCDEGLTGWELHLAGAVHRDSQNAGYFERVMDLARGYPVHVHPDASYEEIQDLYRRASIYWHAAGFGVDVEREPANVEHFGMTTAEAMGHGAVPVVIARGGQPEVVRDGIDGYLWNNVAELKELTSSLVRDAAAREAMGRRARERSLGFSRQEFKRRIVAAIAPVLEGL